MAYKTNWTKDDIVKPDDMNRIEQGIKDAHTSIDNISQSLTPEAIGAAKQADLNAHVQDNSKHVTSAKQDAWNAKETPEGAQAKADAAESNAKAHANNVAGQAETNAKNASLPRTGGTISGDLAVTNTLYVASRNVLWEIDQAKQSGADAKNRIAGAVNAKGVPASANDDWPTLEWKVGQITTGVPFAKVKMTVTRSASFKPYEDATVSSGLYYVIVTGLNFTAKGIYVLGSHNSKAYSSYDSETSPRAYVTGSINSYTVVYRDTLPQTGFDPILATVTPTSFIFPVSYLDEQDGMDATIIVYG